MARIDEVRERYESITEQLYQNKETFAEYLKFAGRFFKMPTAQTMTMFATNPKATMVADYDTWQRFGRQVQRGTNSIAVLDGSGLKHYFDISQTAGGRPPYQWTLDKQTAQEFIAAFSKAEGKEYKSMSGCVNAIGRTAAADNLENAIKALNISETDRAAFEKSFVSITQYFIAARQVRLQEQSYGFIRIRPCSQQGRSRKADGIRSDRGKTGTVINGENYKFTYC